MFWIFFFPEIDQKPSFRFKKRQWIKLGIIREWLFECEMGHIMPKTVFNFKMSHIEQFMAILVLLKFSYKFDKTFWGKKWLHLKKEQNYWKWHFHQTRVTEKIRLKTIWLLKMNHIQQFYSFHLFWSIFRRNCQNKTLISVSNKCEMGHFQSKTALNFKLCHIGKCIAILLFCNIFKWNWHKLTLWGKK